MAASSTALRARRRAQLRSRFWARIAMLAALSVLIVIVLGLLFAGSPSKLASGTQIAGIDVGGLKPTDARSLLAGRAAQLQNVPVTFTFGGHNFKLTPKELGVQVDWSAAVANAARQGGGFGFVRGYRRLELQFFPQNLVPPIRAYNAAVDYELDRISATVNAPSRQAQLVRRGLHVSIAPGKTGRVLDRAAARRLIVQALASFALVPVALPVTVETPSMTVASLTPAQETASRIISAPVTLIAGSTRLRVPRWRLASLLQLPAGGTNLGFGGAAATTWVAKLESTIDRAPVDAGFQVLANGSVHVVPAKPGIGLDVPRSVSRMLAAAERPSNRVANIVYSTEQPQRSTAQAEAMGISGTVSTYETVYGGVPNRIHNVQLVAHLIDNKLIAPGATFSFNGATGARSAAKGFLEAPVIVNGEVQTGLGGGVCQVSTTVFNAAYEAGLPITARTNHALYISHYPLGRDATVDYPTIDLKFVNDTGHWLLLRTYVGTYSLVVGLYGTPQHRRVESIAAPLTTVSPPPVQKTVDPSLAPGQVVVDDPGVPAQSTQVERKVYAQSGKLLSDQTFYSSYDSTPKIVRVGPTKVRAKVKKPTPLTPPGQAPTAPH